MGKQQDGTLPHVGQLQGKEAHRQKRQDEIYHELCQKEMREEEEERE